MKLTTRLDYSRGRKCSRHFSIIPEISSFKTENTVFVLFERKHILKNVFNVLRTLPEKDTKFINHEFTENIARSLSRSLALCSGQSVFQFISVI